MGVSAANRLTITRQLRYSNRHGNTLDVTLALNGIPVATAELKNPMTGQTWRNAVHQYKYDRDPADLIFQFKKRALVHFAVDPDDVYMTTRLAGRNTQFLPFNKGCASGAGNPENPRFIPFQDSDLEKLYSYIRFLLTKLPRDRGPVYDFGDEVALKYYRLQKISEGSIQLEPGKGGEVAAPTAVGTGVARGEQIELSKLIDILNDRFGTDFKPADQLFLDSIREDAVADAGIRQAALANTMENFGYVFLKALEGLFIDRMEQNEDITARFMNDKDFHDVVGKHLLREVYRQIRTEEKAVEEVLAFRRVTPDEKDKYRTCVPLFTLKAAAGGLGDAQAVEPDGWVEPHTKRRLRPGMFVAQVIGRSMEPHIPDGAWCLFQSPVRGTRQGRILLVQHHEIQDPETGGSYTVKRYRSKKESDVAGSWRHEWIRLEPENPEFNPISLENVLDNEFRVIAELIEVLEPAT